MVESKQEFIKSFLPDCVDNVELTQINLDITDLGVGDVLRNIDKIYPAGSRNRNLIASSRMIVGVLCKTVTLDPLNGIFVLITSKDMHIQTLSVNYLVFCIPETEITSDSKIANIVEKLTSYIVKNYGKEIINLPVFYRKFIYDRSEMEEDDDYQVTED